MSRNFLLAGLALLMLVAAKAAAQDADVDGGNDSSQGDVLSAQTAMLIPPTGDELFVAPAAELKSFPGGTIVLRGEATVPDSVIHVRNICRWTARDAPMFAPVADLAITHFPFGRMKMKVTLDEVRQTLRGAGLNPALVSFDGAMECAVSRDDEPAQEEMSLDQWADAHGAIAAAATQSPAQTAAISATSPASAPASPAAADQTRPLRTLRSILAADVSGRLHINPDDLELTFNSADDKVLNLAEPYFQFELVPSHVRSLGDEQWDVVIVYGNQRQKATIDAIARAWQTQAVVCRPVAYQQTIADADVEEKRVLIDALSDVSPLPRSEAIGQAAARDLKPGTVLMPDMIDPVLLAKPGQLITVIINHGSVQITAVAKAMSAGSLGQSIRARGDVDPTKIFEVTLTGPQQGTLDNSRDENPAIAAAAH